MTSIADLTIVIFSDIINSSDIDSQEAFAMSPSNDRSWVNDNERLATVEFEGDIALFRNVRDFN